MNKRGKITIIALAVMVLLVGFFSFYYVLASPEGNVKVFEESGLDYGKISILNAQNTKLAEYTLLENTDQCLTNCHAEGTATLYIDGYLFSDLRFKDKSNELTNINSKILIEVEESYQVDIKDYGEVCKDRLDNGTLKNFCFQEVTGTHQETRYKNVWKEYDNSILSLGNYKWRIEGKKGLHEDVDWIASSFGEDFTEWAWWNSSWDKRKEVNITGGTEILYNFTVLLNVSYDPNMRSDFYDLRFTNESCSSATQDTASELSYEFDVIKNSNYALVWVKIPILNTGINQICMYYKNPSATSGEDPTNTWDDYYKGVYHFSEGNGTTTKDSTGNGNGSFSASGVSWNTSSFYIGNSLKFDGDANTWVNISGNANARFEHPPINLEIFASPQVAGGYRGLISSGNPTPSANDFYWVNAPTSLRYGNDIGGWLGPILPELNNISYFALSYQSGSLKLKLNDYVYETSTSSTLNAVSGLYIGNGFGIAGQGYAWYGTLDEIRISNISRSSAWMNRSYDNLNMTLFSFGTEETKPTPPTHTTPLLKTPTGKNLSTENLTCYNQSTYDANNDPVVNIYNWYKNSQSLAVLNMPFEGGSNSTYTKDYSNYGNDGSVSGATWSSTVGKIKGAYEFDGIDDYILIQDSNSLDFIDKKTWEIWFKRASFDTFQILFDKTNISTNYRLFFRPDNKLEFSYFIPPVPTDFVWTTDTPTEFDKGNYTQTYWNDSAVTLNLTSAEQQIFFDGFESGSFETYKWISSGTGNIWEVSNESPYEETWHAQAWYTGVGKPTTLETNINTVGFHDINLSFYKWGIELDAADNFLVEYFNGTTWNLIETLTAKDTAYVSKSYLLSADANDNPNFKIRFTCEAGATTEGCRIDNVELRGTDTAFYTNGNYTSEVSDSGDISIWRNISWIESLPTNTNLTFQVRSCNDINCSGEIFVGPNNDSTKYFTNPNFNDISFLPDNQYFQYKTYFSTTDIKLSSGLFSVSVGYTKNITDGLINLISTTTITDINWHLTTITFDDAIETNNFNMYIDGILNSSKTEHILPTYFDNDLYIGKRYPKNDWFFNGSIDEFRIYNHALSEEQIAQRYLETKDGLTSSSTIVSQETTGGDVYMCQVTPNDGVDDGVTKDSNNLSVLWAITFNVTSGEDGSQITSLNNIVCNNSWSGGTVSSPFEFGFEPGSYSCTFTKDGFYDKIITFVADNDTTINVKLSVHYRLTIEEHTWLEWLYTCWNGGECWDLLQNINQTTTQTWQRLTGTDTSVITQEQVLSYELSSSSNISINYTIDIPYKSGVAVSELLPIRIYFWFTDVDRTTCYSQDKATDTNRAEAPYCLPLVAEILGPNDGTVSFQVDLRPDLPAGTYNFTRSIEIDPLGIWTQYGREDIGQVEIADSGDASIDVSDESRINKPINLGSSPSGSSGSSRSGDSSVTNVYNTYNTIEDKETEEESENNEINDDGEKIGGGSWLTGGVIGTNLLAGNGLILIVAIIGGVLVVFIVSRTILQIKKKVNKNLICFIFFFGLIFIFFLISCVSATQLYLNESSQWQSNLTAIYWSSLAFGDIDNDGDSDLVAIGKNNSGSLNSKVYLNNGSSLVENSTWKQNLTQVHEGSLALGDIDNDGDLDLALIGCSNGGGGGLTCNARGHTSKIYTNNGTSFKESSQWQSNLTQMYYGSLIFGDLDNDGNLDLITTGKDENNGKRTFVYLNNGTSFIESSQWQSNLVGVTGSCASLGDIDNDGDLDLGLCGDITAVPYQTTKIYLNNGTSLVEDSTWKGDLTSMGDCQLSFSDFDNDGDLDINLIGCCDKHISYRNNGSTFSELQTYTVVGGPFVGIYDGSISVGDYDNDGDLDIASSGNEGYTTIYLNNGSGSYTDSTSDPESDIINLQYDPSIVWKDLDNDNDLDLILIGYNGSVAHSKVYISNASLTKNNTKPNASTSGFSSTYSNNVLTLSWGNGSDTETNTSGLYYNLMVGNSTNNHTIVSGVYGGSSNPTAGYFGNMMQRKSISLNLVLDANKTYNWYIQTIDTGLAKSNWSAVQSFNTSADTTKPNVTIELPSPNASLHTTNPYFIFNATVSDANVSNVTLYADWTGSMVINETNSSGLNGTYTFERNLTGYNDGQYSWYIGANDSMNNTQTSGTRSFYLDRAYPVVRLVSPVNAGSWTSSSIVTFSYNVSDVDIANCSLIIDGSIVNTSSSVSENTQQNFTYTLSNADYNWYVNCSDYVGYVNSSGTRSLTVSYTAPVVSSGGGGGGGSVVKKNVTGNESVATEDIREEDVSEEVSDEVEGGELKEEKGKIGTWVKLVVGISLVGGLVVFWFLRSNWLLMVRGLGKKGRIGNVKKKKIKRKVKNGKSKNR